VEGKTDVITGLRFKNEKSDLLESRVLRYNTAQGRNPRKETLAA